MQFIELEKDGKLYEVEYFADDDTVTIFGEDGGAEVVDIHGMTEIQAARTALRNLIRAGKVSPKQEAKQTQNSDLLLVDTLNYSLAVLRERDFSRLENDAQQAILSLFVDDQAKPSKLGRQTLAMHAGMLGRMTNTPRLEILAMELLMACDKSEVMDALTKITDILNDPNFSEVSIA